MKEYYRNVKVRRASVGICDITGEDPSTGSRYYLGMILDDEGNGIELIYGQKAEIVESTNGGEVIRFYKETEDDE